jgi:hypothetical protein
MCGTQPGTDSNIACVSTLRLQFVAAPTDTLPVVPLPFQLSQRAAAEDFDEEEQEALEAENEAEEELYDQVGALCETPWQQGTQHILFSGSVYFVLFAAA